MGLERSPPTTRRRGRGAPRMQTNARRGAAQVQPGVQKLLGKTCNEGDDEVNEVVDGVSGDEARPDQEEVHVSHEMPKNSHVGISSLSQGAEILDGGLELEVPSRSQRKNGTAVVGKLGASAYRPFGSDIGSDSTCCKGGPGQIVCGNPVEDGESGVQCDKCSNWFHASCQLVPSDAVVALEKFKILTWLCAECKPTLIKQSRVSEKITQLENKVAGLDLSLREHMKVVHASLKEQEIAVAQQTQLMKHSFQEQEALKASYADAVKRSCAEAVSSVKSSVMPPQPLPSVNIGQQAAKEISGMLDNHMDKERRKCNVVIYNLPEETGDSQAERSEKDILKFREIVKKELHLNIRITRAFRAGKQTPGRPRLLIASLENVETKLELLKLARQLRNSTEWNSLFVNPDLTLKEREEGKKLREELIRRKMAGETNLYIRQGRIVQGPASGSQSPEDSNRPLNSGTSITSSEAPKPSAMPSDGMCPNTQQTAETSHTLQGPTRAIGPVFTEEHISVREGQSKSDEQQETAVPSKNY